MALLLRSIATNTKPITLMYRSLAPIANFQYSYSTHNQKSVARSTKSSENSDSSVSTDVRPIGEKIKDTAKTTSYLGVILLGVGVTGALFYTIFSELFSSSSPNAIYADAFEKCKNDPRVQDSLGQPIKCFGEETRRRRRTHVAHQMYEKDGKNLMRMQFHIQGIRNKATVHLEMREDSNGKFKCRYLFVQLDSYPHTTIIIEDNRLNDPLPSLQEPLGSFKSIL